MGRPLTSFELCSLLVEHVKDGLFNNIDFFTSFIALLGLNEELSDDLVKLVLLLIIASLVVRVLLLTLQQLSQLYGEILHR